MVAWSLVNIGLGKAITRAPIQYKDAILPV